MTIEDELNEKRRVDQLGETAARLLAFLDREKVKPSDFVVLTASILWTLRGDIPVQVYVTAASCDYMIAFQKRAKGEKFLVTRLMDIAQEEGKNAV